MKYMLVVALITLGVAASATTRHSRSRSGTSACPDRAWRVLVVGGEIQPNSWCDDDSRAAKRKERNRKVFEKRARERDEYKKKQDEARKRRADDEKAKRAKESERRERERREKERHGCRGVGSGASCTDANPGKGSGKGRIK